MLCGNHDVAPWTILMALPPLSPVLFSRRLDLSYNPIIGTLPSTLTSLSLLSVLSLCDSKLTGELPAWLPTMTNLTAPFVSLSQCSVPSTSCSAGYYCTPDSLSLWANQCEPGRYSLTGAR